MKIRLSILASLAACSFLSSTPSFADDYDEETPTQSKGITSIDGYTELGKGTANGYGLASEYAVKFASHDKAIALAKKAADKDYEDVETHVAYAEALEAKLRDQTDRDPYLFNSCIKEWLIVLRNEAGDEKGMTFHGIGIMGKMYSDSDRGDTARRHLKDLAGAAPKLWETDAKYLARVCKPVDANVTAKKVADKAEPKAPAQ